MTVFDERPAPSPARRRLPLLGLPVLAVLVWIAAAHSPPGIQAVEELRGNVPTDTSANQPMAEALLIRRDLLMHPGVTLSLTQGRRLVGFVGSPINEESQSEALDVLGLALRAGALSAPQARDANTAALEVLRGSPAPMVRLESARLLGHLKTLADAPVLAALQHDSDPKVRQAAEEGLNRLAVPNR